MIVLAGQSNANHPATLGALRDYVYPTLVVKAAWNATPLAPVREDGWHWQPGVGNCYIEMVKTVQETYRKPEWFFWVQGESDVAYGTANNYVENFREFRKEVRKDLDAPDLKFGIVRLTMPILREAQEKVADDEPRSFLIDIDDVPMGDGTFEQQYVKLTPGTFSGERIVHTRTVEAVPPWDAILKIHFTEDGAKRLGARLGSFYNNNRKKKKCFF